MPTPAEVLLEASSLDSGTPWELLNSIEVGTGVCEGVILYDGLEIEMGCPEYDVEINLHGIEVEINPVVEFEVEKDTVEYDVEICDG